MTCRGHSGVPNHRYIDSFFKSFMRITKTRQNSILVALTKAPRIARFIGPTWGPPGSCRPQMGPKLAPRTLLSGVVCVCVCVCVCVGGGVNAVNVFLFISIPWPSDLYGQPWHPYFHIAICEVYSCIIIRTLHDCLSQMNESLLISNSKLTSDSELIWWH